MTIQQEQRKQRERARSMIDRENDTFYRFRQKCLCGHTAFVHDSAGKGWCTGFLTVYDGAPDYQRCGCDRFEEEK